MSGPTIELVQCGEKSNKMVMRLNLLALQLLRDQIMGVSTEYENRQLIYGTKERSVITSPVGSLVNGATFRVELVPDEGALTAEVTPDQVAAALQLRKANDTTMETVGNIIADTDVPAPSGKTYRIVDGHLKVDGDDTIYEAAQVGVDGNCGFALLGPNLQEGEAEFVEIPPSNDKDNYKSRAMWACQTAMWNLRKRLNLPDLTYYMDRSHPNFC